MGSTTAVLGVFIAAAFVKNNAGGHGGWPWAYYFNAFVYAVTGVAVFATYFPPPPLLRRQGEGKSLLSHVDYVGILLLCGSLASLLLGLTWGGTTYAWSSGTIIATLTCGCVGLAIFGLWEWLGKKDGLFDHRLLQTANFLILLVVCCIDGMLLLGVNVLYAQEIADLFSTDPVRIAVILCPYLITSTFGCFPAGWIMARTKSYRTLLVGALLWCSLFLGLMALINPNRLAMACTFSALFGIATAITTVIPIVALTLSVPSFLLGIAGTLSVSIRALGGIIGITIFTAIFNNKYAAHLASYVPAAVLGQGYNATVVEQVMGLLASPNPAALPMSGLPPKLIGGVESAVAFAKDNSWTFVWVAVACLVAANAVIACFLKSVAPNMNHHIESALENGEVRQAQLEGKVGA
jgi:MFS family permease